MRLLDPLPGVMEILLIVLSINFPMGDASELEPAFQ